MSDTPSDFNDLHTLQGLDEVKRQIEAAFYAVSPAPSIESVRDSLEGCLARYQLTDEANVWDDVEQKILRKHKVATILGEKLFKEWLNSPSLGMVSENQKRAVVAAYQKDGEGSLSEALRRYTLLYPTAEVWDSKKREIVEVKNLKIHIADCYEYWIKHPEVRRIDKENLVFDPERRRDPNTHINMFRGLPLKPERNDALAGLVLKLVEHLCNKDEEIIHYLLCWLAYPLQRVGAKLSTAVMMHSETQGTGKSLLFDVVMRPIYGDYGATLGQHQMDGNYNDWSSRKLWGVFEEIFSRDQKYSHTGTIKQMITGDKHRIEKKFVSSWEEANHMNAVFLSNEIQPFPVEPTDRRMMVVWPEKKLSKKNVAKIVDVHTRAVWPGVCESWLEYLLRYDIGDFHSHIEPPMTDAKQRLIDFGMPSWDTFYQVWTRGGLDVPFQTCLSTDLYEAYRWWCKKNGEHVVTHTRFGGFIAGRLRRRNDVEYAKGLTVKKGTFVFTELVPDGVKQGEYLGLKVKEFKDSLAEAQRSDGYTDSPDS